MKRPFVDYGECKKCDACIELCPSVFSYNDMGFIEIADAVLDTYPEDEVNEAIANCPADCIYWEIIAESKKQRREKQGV